MRLSVRWLIDRLRPRHASPGQVAVIFALLGVTLVAALGFAIDGANLYRERRDLQSAADLAALAGAVDLPNDLPAARAAAETNAGENVSDVVPMITTPYDGSNTKIEVSLTRNVNTFFMGMLGFGSVEVTARAVAEHSVGKGAIFAGKNTCGDGKAIEWAGSGATVTGDVHSNNGMTLPGSNTTVNGAVTYVCSVTDGGSGDSYTSGPSQTGIRPWPVTFSPPTPCTYSMTGDFDLSQDGDWWVGGTKASKQLKPGIYCAKGSSGLLKLSDSGISGNVTFYSGGTIEISGQDFHLTPYVDGLLMFAGGTDTPTMKLAASDGEWEGALYAPGGQIEISGSEGFTLTGSIIAWTVKLPGSTWTLNATADGPGRLRLIE